MRTLRIYSLNNFPVHPTAVWAVCTCVLVQCVYISVAWVLGSRTARSPGTKPYSFPNGCIHLHYSYYYYYSHKLCVGILLAPRPPPHFNHFSECIEVLHCDYSLFLVSNEAERISIGLLAIGVSFSVKLLF